MLYGQANVYRPRQNGRRPPEALMRGSIRGVTILIFPNLIYFPHHEKLSPVGSYPDGASPYGVLDMAGNVAEWCADNIHDKDKKAVRGGGWNSMRLHLRSTHRVAHPPSYRYYNIGFRCAKDIE